MLTDLGGELCSSVIDGGAKLRKRIKRADSGVLGMSMMRQATWRPIRGFVGLVFAKKQTGADSTRSYATPPEVHSACCKTLQIARESIELTYS